MFTPLRTERLLLRPARESDIDALYDRRADPRISDWQDWPMPYTRERAESRVRHTMSLDSPPDNGGWMLTIVDLHDSVVYGDMTMFLEDDGRTSGVGYSISHEYWGQGFASESLAAVVAWLFDVKGVSRVYAQLAPDNHRSARVLETCGFVFEGETKNSCWIEERVEDDRVYGLTPALRTEWNERVRAPANTVELVEPYPNGLRRVIELSTHKSQERMVAPIAVSLAQVAVPPFQDGFAGKPGDPRRVLWPRIVHADGEPVGFVMLEEPTAANSEAFLWRLLIDRLHQRRGIGQRVVQAVIDQAVAWDCKAIGVSWVPGVGSPESLYLAMGFEPTGEIDDGEVVARRVL